MDSEDGRVHSNNPHFVVRGFSHSGISLALNGINIEEDSDENISDDYGKMMTMGKMKMMRKMTQV